MFKGAAQLLEDKLGAVVNNSPSPLMNWLKPVVLSVEHWRLVFSYTVRKEMTNPFGTLHGGIIAAIIDDIIGATLIVYEEPCFYVSINLSVDYFSSAREGDVIVAESDITRKGSRIANAHCKLWNEDRSKLLAQGNTNLLKTNIK